MTDKEKVDAAVKARIDAGWPAKLKKKIKAHMASRKTTPRTKQVTSSLKNAGLTEDELKRLRGQ